MKTIKIKLSDYNESLAHPGAEPGNHGRFSVYAVENVPSGTSAAEVLLWFRRTYVPVDRYIIDFASSMEVA